MISAAAQMKKFEALTKSITLQTQKMEEVFGNLTKTMQGLNKAQKPLTEAEKKIESVKAAIERAEGAATGFDKRTQILNKAIKQSFIDGEKGFALGIKSFRQYRKAGGNAFEYVAEFLGTSKEELRIFGIEAAKVRSVMFGFLPPGTFRLVNKFKSSFQLIGGVIRSISADTKESGEEFDNLFIKMGRGMRKLGQFKVVGDGEFFPSIKAKKRKQEEERALQASMFGPVTKQEAASRTFQMKFGDRKDALAAAKDKTGMNRLRKEIKSLPIFGKTQSQANRARGMKRQLAELKKNRKSAIKREKLALKTFKRDNGVLSKAAKFRKLIGGLVNVFLNVFIKYFIIISLGLIAAFVLLKAFGPSIKDALMRTYELIAPLFEYLLVPLSALWEGLKGLWNAFFGDGDFESLIDSLLLILAGIVGTAIGLILIALAAIIVFLFEFGKSLGERFMEFWRTTQDIGAKAAIIVALIVGVIALIAGAPVWIAAAIAAGAAYLVIKLAKILKGMNPLEGFQRRANGGVVTSPVTMVGETGPEMVSLPRGSKVHSASDTKKMMGNNINITVNAKDTSRAEMNRIANEIASIVSSKISRTTNSRTFR